MNRLLARISVLSKGDFFSPLGLPLAATWLQGKVQSLKFAIQDWMYG